MHAERLVLDRGCAPHRGRNRRACRSVGAAPREVIERNGPKAAVAATVCRNFLREREVWDMCGSVLPLRAILQP